MHRIELTQKYSKIQKKHRKRPNGYLVKRPNRGGYGIPFGKPNTISNPDSSTNTSCKLCGKAYANNKLNTCAYASVILTRFKILPS